MARPQKEGLDYFSHDTDAVNDEKVEALRAVYGNDGYAFYFILLERIYRSPQFELDISDAETVQILANKIMIPVEKFHLILETALKRGCFDKENYETRKVLTSNGVKKRAAVVVEKREKMRSKYQNKVSEAETKEETKEETPQSKVKKSKEKKSKEKEIKKEYAPLVHMTETEHQKLVDKHGPDLTAQMIEKLDNYKGASGKKYKSDYKAILTWVVDEIMKKVHQFPRGRDKPPPKAVQALRNVAAEMGVT